MFPFDPLENIRKPKTFSCSTEGFLIFSGTKSIGNESVKIMLLCYLYFVEFIKILHSRRFYLKLVSAVFYQIFTFHQMIALQKLWKMFFISSKKLFSFSRYSNVRYFRLPLFSPLSAIALEADPRKISKLSTV